MIAIIHLLINSFMIGTSCIGVITIINKIGKLCKIIDENKKDGFKIGFDSIMLDLIDETNKCVESISSITYNVNKIIIIIYDISLGNKFIKKDKDGKIIICNKSKIYSSYKSKIEELSNRVKKYQEELNKVKKPNKSDDSSKNNSLSDDDTYSDVSSETESSSSSNENKSIEDNKSIQEKDISNDIIKNKNVKDLKNDEFFLG